MKSNQCDTFAWQNGSMRLKSRLCCDVHSINVTWKWMEHHIIVIFSEKTCSDDTSQISINAFGCDKTVRTDGAQHSNSEQNVPLPLMDYAMSR